MVRRGLGSLQSSEGTEETCEIASTGLPLVPKASNWETPSPRVLRGLLLLLLLRAGQAAF